MQWKVRTPGAPPPGKFLGHGKCDDFSKSITFEKPVNTVPVIAAGLVNVIGQFMEKHKVPATELRGFAVSMTRIVLEKEIETDNAANACAPKEQSSIQTFAKFTTASQFRASVHPRAFPTGTVDPDSLVDLTDLPTQAHVIQKTSKKVQKRITREQLRIEPLPKRAASAIVISDLEDEEDELENELNQDETQTPTEVTTLPPKQNTVDFELLVSWLETEATERRGLSVLDEHLLQCRLTSLLTDSDFDLETATRLLRTLKLFCKNRDVDASWDDVLKRLTTRANELIADTLGLPCGATLVL